MQAQASFHLKGWYKEQAGILTATTSALNKATLQAAKGNQNKLDSFDKYLELISPQNILKRGYSLTLKNGKAIKNASDVNKGDEIRTLLSDGDIKSIVK